MIASIKKTCFHKDVYEPAEVGEGSIAKACLSTPLQRSAHGMGKMSKGVS
jgi:hypothetical protein